MNERIPEKTGCAPALLRTFKNGGIHYEWLLKWLNAAKDIIVLACKKLFLIFATLLSGR
jgi:hypothetical protein